MNKDTWHRTYVRWLGQVAKELGIPTKERTIRSNKAGPAVGGEVMMSAPIFGIFVNLACPRNSYNEAEYPAYSYARGCSPDCPYGTSMRFPNYGAESTLLRAAITERDTKAFAIWLRWVAEESWRRG
jgi:hypothetical protein